MKKKKAIRDYILLSLFIVVTILLSFISFPIPTTNYTFVGFANMHKGLELGGGVKNTYTMEVADWYKGSDKEAYNDALERVQNLLNKYYADATAYFSEEDKITIEVPDSAISESLTTSFFEIKSAEGESAEIELDGRDVNKAEFTSAGTTYGVYIEFTEDGTKKLRELTSEVSSSGGSIYIYWNKDYENPVTLSISGEMDYIFLQGEGISSKDAGELYAYRVESSKIGVNMTTDLDPIEVSPRFGNLTNIMIIVATIAMVVASIIVMSILFRQLGLVSSVSLLFAFMFSVVVSAIFDLQVTFYGWIGFMVGYVINFTLHLYYLSVIKNEYAKGKKFTVSFTSSYKKSLFNMLDIILITLGSTLLLLIVPSSAIKMFVFNLLMTIPATAFTSLLLNKIVCVDYTAFNTRHEKKVNFVREEDSNEIK
jgi:preprotein translocase subunit SecD